jgi:hypothetical protein
VGACLWYLPDTSERYFKNYRIRQYVPLAKAIRVQAPWWQFDLEPDQALVVEQPISDTAPDGRWFIDVLGHAVGTDSAGAISVDGHRLELDVSQGPRWHRIYLDDRPSPAEGEFALQYHPGDPAEPAARFRLWGTYSRLKRSPRRVPTLVSALNERPLPVPAPIPLRRGNLAPEHNANWRDAYRLSSVDPFFRVGVQTGVIGSKAVGGGLILVSVGLIACLLAIAFIIYAIEHPAPALALLAISLAALWLRLGAVESLIDEHQRMSDGVAVRHNLWWDSAAYFSLALSIFSNETPGPLKWPIGMPTFSSYLFRWDGVRLDIPKYGFALLHTLVGPALYFACRKTVRNEFLALVPVLLWAVFLRPVKYSFYFLSETTAMCLMVAWVAILLSRDLVKRSVSWPWMVGSCSILFVLSTHSRDVVITFLPAFLGMVYFFACGRVRDRLISTVGALVVVVALWCANPLLFSNKSFSDGIAGFLAVTPKHYSGAQRAAGDPAGGSSIFGIVGNSATELLSRPSGYLQDVYSDSRRFWDPRERWANWTDVTTVQEWEDRERQLAAAGEPDAAADVRAAYQKSTPARFVLNGRPGGTYELLLVVVALTSGFGLVFSTRWRALAGLLLYVTLFQVLLFPKFTARPRAIFFPEVVLLASLGVFAAVESFPAWLRTRMRGASSGP